MRLTIRFYLFVIPFWLILCFVLFFYFLENDIFTYSVYSKIGLKLLRFILKIISRLLKFIKNLSKFYQNLSKIYQNISKYIKIYQNISKYIKIYQNI